MTELNYRYFFLSFEEGVPKTPVSYHELVNSEFIGHSILSSESRFFLLLMFECSYIVGIKHDKL